MSTKETRKRKTTRGRRKKRKRQKKIKRTLPIIRRIFFSMVVAVLLFVAGTKIDKIKQIIIKEEIVEETFGRRIEEAPEFEVQLLTPNPYSRSQAALKEIKGIVIHYTANPGTTAQQNRNYFEGLKDSKITKASSHFIVGIEGEIIQCIPSSEIAYASNKRNVDTLSIECCHVDETGKFSKETYDSLVHLVSWLCGKFNLTSEDIIRHYDVTGKMCPLYYVEHEDAWQVFLQDVQKYIDEHGVN